MSEREWRSGTIANIRTISDETDRAVRRGGVWMFLDRESYAVDGYVTEVRPLVVLDIAELAWLPNRLRHDASRIGGVTAGHMRRIADDIEAQIEPLKPDEPTGLGAVVVDADGLRWTRSTDSPKASYPWSPNQVGQPSAFAQITVVRVLSEGVQP